MKRQEQVRGEQWELFWREAEALEQNLIFPADPFGPGP
jgi:hypothetical protein